MTMLDRVLSQDTPPAAADVLAALVESHAKPMPAGSWPRSTHDDVAQNLTLDMAIEAFGESDIGSLLKCLKRGRIAAVGRGYGRGEFLETEAEELRAWADDVATELEANA